METTMEIDFDGIKDAIAFAGNAGGAVERIAEAANVVYGLFDAAQLGADPDVKFAMSKLALQVANAKEANAFLLQRLTALEAQIGAAKAKQADFDRYELWETPAGTLVHRLKESDDTGEPPHFLCPDCMEGKRKSILQGKNTAECYACGKSFPINTTTRRKRNAA